MILIATPTWNRRAIVTLTAAGLAASDRRPEDTDYLVTDDASTEYTEEDLKALFPWARISRQPHRFPNHLMNTYVCFSEFLKGTYSHLVILDSDMIVRPDWRVKLDELIQTPNFRIGSLYNSLTHKPTQDCGSYCVKATAGFAGMVFTREVLEAFLANHAPKNAQFVHKQHDDFAVCRFVGPVFQVSKPSVLAHIGINGLYNGSNYHTIDRAADFEWSSIDPGLKKDCETLLRVTL
jgi:hypothetical protein